MDLSDLQPVRPRREEERVVAALTEVRRVGGRCWIEDAQGRAVPASLDLISTQGVTVTPAFPLDLAAGNAAHLIFILDHARFKAPSRVLRGDAGRLTVALPALLQRAERRRQPRSFLNVALVGLFSPLAAAAAAPEPAGTYLVEPGSPVVALDRLPLSEALAGQGRAFQTQGLLNPGGTQGTSVWVSYVHDWLQTRTSTLYERAHTPRQTWLNVRPPLPQRSHGGLLGQGCSFHFLPFTLPGTGLGPGRGTSVRFEARWDRHSVQVGIRLK